MPIYEYRCHDCQRRVSIFWRSFSDLEGENAVPHCPRCGGTNLTRLVSRVAVLRSEESRLDDLTDPGMLAGLDEEDPKEVEASKHGLSYIALDGNIGCMVNGAGLAMSTMDIIKLHGGMPANFLDVGGSATKEQVAAAFRILCGDAHVQAILINIFGGIAKCDVIAQGVVDAAKEISLDRPLVVRLEGTNVEKGRSILEDSGLALETAASLDEAAEKAVKAAKGGA